MPVRPRQAPNMKPSSSSSLPPIFANICRYIFTRIAALPPVRNGRRLQERTLRPRDLVPYFDGLGRAEAPRIGLDVRHGARCPPGDASRTTRKPAVSKAAASCLPPALIRAGGPRDTHVAASARMAATSSNGTASGRDATSGMRRRYRMERNAARTCRDLSPAIFSTGQFKEAGGLRIPIPKHSIPPARRGRRRAHLGRDSPALNASYPARYAFDSSLCPVIRLDPARPADTARIFSKEVSRWQRRRSEISLNIPGAGGRTRTGKGLPPSDFEPDAVTISPHPHGPPSTPPDPAPATTPWRCPRPSAKVLPRWMIPTTKNPCPRAPART